MSSNNVTFHVPVTHILIPSNISTRLILTTTMKANYDYFFHFTDEEIKLEGHQITFPSSHRGSVVESEFQMLESIKELVEYWIH